MSIEAIKEKARKFEQKEQWQKALDLYLQAIDQLDQADEADISLFNRVGDLEVRMDRVEDAVEHYERAVDLYMESELPNNAIAVCKKVARNFPDQHSIFLKMGQIRASQGFLTDARQNFVKYAEEKQDEGDIEAALDALIQFVELAPEDIEIRLALAEQLAQHDRTDAAVEQFREARRRLILDGREDEAEGAGERIRELAPEVEVADAEAIRAAGPAEAPSAAPVEDAWESSFSDFSSGEEDEAEAPEEAEPADDEEAEIEGDFGEIALGGDEEADEAGEGAGEEVAEVAEETLDEFDVGEDEGDEGFGEPEDEAGELPGFDHEEEGFDADEGDGGEDFALDDADDGELDDEGGDLPTFGFGEDEEEAGEVETLAGEEAPEEDVPEEAPDEEPEGERELDASAFGAREEGDHSELAELDAGLEEISGEEDEEGAEPEEPADEPAAEAVEEAMEEEAGDDWLAAVDAGADESAEEPVAEEAPPEAEEEAPVAEVVDEEGPEALRDRGLELREEGEADEADRLLERAHDGFAEAGRMDEAMDALEARIEARPDDVELRQRLVEYAYRTTEDEALVSAYLGLAGTLRDAGNERKARSVYQQVLDTDPENEEAQRALAELSGEAAPEAEARKEVASSEEYVDLGSLVLDEEEEEKSTRFVVAADAPSGDEQADFNKMLSQFKEKISENVATDDVAAHYDLGTAYKEMGLVDEAISEFQAALRAARDHLPTYEMLGQCFMEKGEYQSAARTLKKALDTDYEVEDELLGIYYFLGRAHEAMGDDDQAVEYYDRVFDLDINFMDVTERLRELR